MNKPITVVIDILETNRYRFEVPADEVEAFQADSSEWLATHGWSEGADGDVLDEEVQAISAWNEDDTEVEL